MIYYRRTDGFPATRVADIEVSDKPMPTGTGDNDWRAVEAGDHDLLASGLGLDGGHTDPWLIADAIVIARAIAKHRGRVFHADPAWWPRGSMDPIGDVGDGMAAIRDACHA